MIQIIFTRGTNYRLVAVSVRLSAADDNMNYECFLMSDSNALLLT